MSEAKDERTEPEGASTEELSEEQLAQVNGGQFGLLLPAVLKMHKAAGDGSVVPTDQVSLNFTNKIIK